METVSERRKEGREGRIQLPYFSQSPYGGFFPWQGKGAHLARTHVRSALCASHLALSQRIPPTNSLLYPRLVPARLTPDSLRVGIFLPMLGHRHSLGEQARLPRLC